MRDFAIGLNSEIKGCCFCGTPTSCGKEAEFIVDCREIVYAEYAQIIAPENGSVDGRPVCRQCQIYWNKLSTRTGRAITSDEFLIWVISQISKGTRAGRHFQSGGPAEHRASVWGVLYADFMQVLLDDAGRDVKLICPECGESCISTHPPQGDSKR